MAIENEATPTPEPTSPEPTNTPPDPEALNAAKEAARAEERKKLQDTIDHHKTAAEKASAKLQEEQERVKAAKAEADDIKARLKELEESNLSKEEKTDRRIEELTSNLEKLTAKITETEERHTAELEKVADTAATQIVMSDLKALLAKLTNGLNLDPDLMPTVVAGDTSETVTAKVERAKAIQARILGQKAEAADEAERKAAEAALPTPVSPDASGNPPRTDSRETIPTDAKGRRRIASMSGDEYRAARDKLLQKAVASAPDGNPYIKAT